MRKHVLCAITHPNNINMALGITTESQTVRVNISPPRSD